MKNKKPKTNLDDFAFEGRNQEYGAYSIRKTYHARLFRSFLYSIALFSIMLLLFGRIVRLRLYDYYYNSQQDVQVVGVNLTKIPYNPGTHQIPGETSIPVAAIPQRIVADVEEIVKKEEPVNPSSGNSDTTETKGGVSGTSGESGIGKEGGVYGSADINPQFPGGIKAMQQFIKANLRYPEIARKSNIRGTIQIYAVITSQGAVTDVKVVKGLLAELDEEAVNMVKSMPLWKPAIRGGVPVSVRCIIPISVNPQQ